MKVISLFFIMAFSIGSPFFLQSANAHFSYKKCEKLCKDDVLYLKACMGRQSLKEMIYDVKEAGKNALGMIDNNYITDVFFDPHIFLWRDTRGRTLMHYAVKERRLMFCVILYLLGFDINAQDDEGNTPLLNFFLEDSLAKELPVVFITSTELNSIFIGKLKKTLEKIDDRYKSFDYFSKIPFQEDAEDVMMFLIDCSSSLSVLNKNKNSIYHFFNDASLYALLRHAFLYAKKEMTNEIVLELIQRRKERDDLDDLRLRLFGISK